MQKSVPKDTIHCTTTRLLLHAFCARNTHFGKGVVNRGLRFRKHFLPTKTHLRFSCVFIEKAHNGIISFSIRK